MMVAQSNGSVEDLAVVVAQINDAHEKNLVGTI
jgi:hypothetical protein